MYLLIVISVLCSSSNIVNSSGRPNFVFILTDDQDLHLDGLVPMTKTLQLVANEGIIFERAFTNTPVCCPSRSSLLTGRYAHSINVYNNSISGNCSSPDWQANFEPKSFAALLKEKGNYNTFYAGKYLNQYGSKAANGIAHVPQGYDWWFGLKGNSRYYNYTLSVNGTGKYFETEYLTDVIKNYACDFLNQNHARRNPFFMMVAPPAPHAPFTPAQRHRNAFPNVTAVQNPAFNFTPTQKHWLVRMKPTELPEVVTKLDDIQRHRLQTLLSVDEMVEDIVQVLKTTNILENTYIIFTSDNGYHIGQFTQPWDKRQPYQSDINIPFFMSGPGIAKKIVSKFPVSLVDVAPTLLDLADIEIPASMDGISFKQELFHNNCSNCSKNVLIEYWGEGNDNTVDNSCELNRNNDLAQCGPDNWCKCQDSRNNTYSCIVTMNLELYFKFCRFDDNEHFYEAYDLLEDPYELHNIFHTMSPTTKAYYKSLLDKTSSCSGVTCKNEIKL